MAGWTSITVTVRYAWFVLGTWEFIFTWFWMPPKKAGIWKDAKMDFMIIRRGTLIQRKIGKRFGKFLMCLFSLFLNQKKLETDGKKVNRRLSLDSFEERSEVWARSF